MKRFELRDIAIVVALLFSGLVISNSLAESNSDIQGQSLPRINEYTLVIMDNYDDFVNEVNSMVGSGWRPIGGVSLDNGFHGQAMGK